jgi:hypothetical protein
MLLRALPRHSVALGLLIAAASAVAPAEADVINSQWIAGSGNWNVAANWNPAVVPNNGAGDVFHVTINGSGSEPFVQLNMGATIQSLAVTNTALFQFNNGQSLTARTGPIVNESAILMASTGTNTNLIIGGILGDDVINLSGGGIIQMSANTSNRIYGAADTNRLVNHDNLIRGAGQIGVNLMRFTNHGTVRANQTGARLHVDPRDGANGVINNGVMEAVDSGILRLDPGQFVNTNGLIRSRENSTVDLFWAEVLGGQVIAEADSAIRTVGASNQVSHITGHLIIDPTARLDITDRTQLRFHPQGTYENYGKIRLLFGGWHAILEIDGDVSISGGGEISLNHSNAAIIRGIVDTHRLTNVDNVIRGTGRLGYNQMRFTNFGTVRADQAIARLYVDPRDGANDMINNGLMEAVDSGILRLDPGQFVNTNGLIRAGENSTVELFWAEVLGGQVIAESDSAISTAGAGDSVNHISGHLIIDPTARLDVTDRTHLRLHPQGTYVNEGMIQLLAPSNYARLQITGDVAVTGGGEILLPHGESTINGVDGTHQFTNVDNFIRGRGRIGTNNIGITNHGTIDADSLSVMTIDPHDVLGMENTGMLRASSLGGMVIAAGPFTTSGDVIVEDISNITRTGNFIQTGGTTSVFGDLQVNSGSVTLDGGALTGDGRVIGPVVNNAGSVRPGGDFDDDLLIQGAYTQSADGELLIEMTQSDSKPWLAVTGSATLGGTLRLVRAPGVVPQIGVPYTVLTAGSLTGAFDNIDSSDLVEVSYDAGTVVVTYLGACVFADLNCDGVVDVLDLLILLDNWGACPPVERGANGKCGDCPADLNGDCSVDVLDLLILLDNWG